MMTYKKPYLEPYAGPGSRHECPACHDKHSFVYYLDGETGKMIHETVGRCNRESKCGYHYPPREYFKTTKPRRPLLIPWPEEWGEEYPQESQAQHQYQPPEPPRKPDFIPAYHLKTFSGRSSFLSFLSSLFGHEVADKLRWQYHLGAHNNSVIFWQIDVKDRVRTGKIMQYNRKTGKRIKNATGAIDWVHAMLRREGDLPKDFSMVQCLFGEHLLSIYPDRIVALVESEKSAIIGACVFPDYVWLATGGKSQISRDRMRVLKERTVIMFPDADGYETWRGKAKEMQANGINVIVSDLIENNATPEDKEAQIDLADWLIRDLTADREDDSG